MGKEYYELTAPQKSIWLTEQYYKNTNINNLCGTFYINEKIDFELLKQSLNIFLKNNDSFKIMLDYTNDKVSQYFSEIDYIDFEIIDIKNDKDLENLENKVSSKCFNLLNSLLFDVVLFRYSDGHGGFIFNSHHIVSDSWANGIVANDVGLIYSKLKNNEDYSKSPELSYKAYINAEREYVHSAKFEKDKKYWEEVFSTVPEVATIPSVKETLKDDDLSANRLLLDIDNEILKKLNDYCTKYKISLYNFFMTIFALYLGRVSNLDDFVIGTPILNRTNYKEKQTTGMFINTLPLRINLSHNKTFIDNLKDIAINSMSLLRHQKYSFQYIIEDLRKKDSNLPKLYNVLYSYQVTKMNETTDCLNHTSSWIFNRTISDDLDIHMFEWDKDNSIKIAYDYRTSKYEEQDMKDIHARILHVINQVLENEKILLKDIEIVTPEEKHKILYEFNDTKVDYPKDKTIIDLFEEQVEKTPDNIAVVFEDQQLTYRELNERANYVAQKFKFFNKNICILCDKNIEMVIGILAILKSGNCYVPIDPQSPENRINFIIEETNCNLLLTTEKYIKKYEHINHYIINFDYKLKNNINNSAINNNAYIIFTSGTTGNPKGVEVLNKSIVNTLLWRKYFYNFNSTTTTLQIPSFAFDSSVEDIFTSLISGSKLVIPSHKINEVPDLINSIKKYNITHFLITPALYNLFLEFNPSSISSLDFITVAGEDFNIDLVEKHFSVFPNTRLYNEYGPTENSVCSTVYELTKNSKKIYIGKPISNSIAYIVSNSGSLLPVGTPGELCFGGNGIVKGYLNNSSLTQEKFVDNPFSQGYLYKTGDLARWSSDGNIEFIGRIDNQIKIRGFRIELNEIDANILTYPDIKQTISVVQNINTKKIICSYIVGNQNIDINKLKIYLSKTLTNYMIPTYIMQLETLPLNINGKIDKKLLPVPKVSETQKEITKIRNKIDKSILNIINNSLSLKDISIEDNLFEIGIDSLSAITLSFNISKELNVQITVRDILKNPIIKDLSDYISTIYNNRYINTIKQAEIHEYYPLSSAQKRIYYSSNMDSNSTLYNIAGGIIINKLLDINKLQNCFNILIKRHDALRTHFDVINNEIVQVVDDNINFNLHLDESKTTDLNKIYDAFVKPFNLSKAPLFRTKLVKLENEKMLFLLDMHHIISDGTSISILLQELCDLYNNNELIEKQIDYKDFTLWEKEQFESQNFKSSKEYWVNQFKDEIPLLNMPTTYPRPSMQSFEGSNYHVKLSKEIFNKINEISKKLNITPYMLMLSCYYILLSKYTSQDDITIGTPIIGRELPELSNVLGMFVNTLALRNKIDGSLTFEKFSKIIKENCLNSFKNQNYPFNMLIKDLNIKREISRNPLFDVMFIFQNNGYPEINFENIKAEYFIPYNNISKFDLSLEVIPAKDEYSLRFEYCTKLFDEDFITRFASHYITILNVILNNYNIKIADIDMLSEKERNKILFDFNNTKVDYTKYKTIIDLFEEQVEKTPNNIAVVFENKMLTYKELNEKSNQLARYLINNNISANSVVSIMVPRCLEILIGILAVLKAGACYIPIDPSLPEERIYYMLQNSNTSLLLKTNNIKDISFNNVINIDISNKDIYELEKTNLNVNINPENLSYIIYTSGSTGKPKGVALKHKSLYNLANYLNNTVSYFKDVYSNLAIASITTISFDIFIFETLLSLQRGLKVIIANENEQTNLTLLDNLIEKHNIQAIQMTPSRMEILINNKNYMSHLSNLKYITLAGEALSASLKDEILKLGNITIYNGYGPSETTVFSTFTNVTNQETITIGKPLSNTYMYVLDKNKHLCPVGVPGELYISGDGVGLGYLNNEDLTNKSFVEDIFNTNLKMYKTGDLVKYLPNNELYYIGRTDNQIKIRGLRIELDEIQNWIKQYKDINKVIISSDTDKNDRQYIIAYLTVTNRISINNLKIFLRSHLPGYMIPTYFIILDDFPYLPNGKINKKALPLPSTSLDKQQQYIAPRNKLETDIVSAIEKLLSISPISIDDNFFEIGGDSLTAMSLQLELMKLNINVTYSDIFMHPTVKQLSENILLDSHTHSNQINNNDTAQFNNILDNCITLPDTLTYSKTGNILLAGVTGFLGAHILDSFLSNESGIAYCLIRLEPGLTIEQKLLNKLHYYFDKKYDSLIGKRIIPIISDISFSNLGLTEDTLNDLANKVDIVINSAAKVSHYGNYIDYKKINVDGTQNLVDFCKKNNKRFYQISTLSVSGSYLLNDSYISKEFYENNFYINQSLDNVYVRSKFESEKIVLNNILNGLDGYIIRVGNLMNRLSDGKFQQNITENAYINRLIAYYKIGFISKDILDGYLELTPVDCCANAILKLVQHTSKSNRIFHLLNHKNISILNFINTINKLYDKIEIVSTDIFYKIIQEYLNDSNKKNYLLGLINDFDENKKITYSSHVKINSDFTIQYLNKVGFEWPELNEDYIIKFLNFFNDLNLLKRKDDK